MVGPIVITAGDERVSIPQPVVLDPDPPGWTSAWSAEFAANAQVALNSGLPLPAVSGSGWNVRTDYQSNHLGFNTPSNVTLQADGLHITAKRETGLPGQPASKPYTTGYLDTIGRFSQRYGRFQIRAKLPTGKGLWPAFWLRCDSTLGEIDVLEAVGGLAQIEQTVHQSTNGDMDKIGFVWRFPAGWNPRDWHVYACEWDPDGTMRWYVDDTLTVTRTPAQLDNQGKSALWLAGPTFASPANIRLNLQVGGSMPNYYGLPVDASTVMPDDLIVSYVRAYQRS